MTVVRAAIHGAKGRMGQRIAACAALDASVNVVALLDQGDTEAWIASRDAADVVLDFSSDAGAQLAVRAALAKRAALLVGTTALASGTVDALRKAAESIGVLLAPNTSLGVAVARRLVREAAKLLAPDFDAEIVERHHRGKVDAPSGTAKALAESSAAGGLPIDGPRIHAQRIGDVVGEHVVTFAGPGEVLEIRHAATSRDLFAIGALRLGSWLARRGAGWHTVDEWIDERSKAAGVRPS